MDTISTIRATRRTKLDVKTTGAMTAPTKPMAGHSRTKATQTLGRTATTLTTDTTILDIINALAETLVLLPMKHRLRGLQPRVQIIIGVLSNLTGKTHGMDNLQATQDTPPRLLCSRNGTCGTGTRTSVGKTENCRSAENP